MALVLSSIQFMLVSMSLLPLCHFDPRVYRKMSTKNSYDKKAILDWEYDTYRAIIIVYQNAEHDYDSRTKQKAEGAKPQCKSVILARTTLQQVVRFKSTKLTYTAVRRVSSWHADKVCQTHSFFRRARVCFRTTAVIRERSRTSFGLLSSGFNLFCNTFGSSHQLRLKAIL